eukprot:364619-Chlamydomonas_euryale.AAC.4
MSCPNPTHVRFATARPQAQSDEDRKSWIDMIQAVINCLLNSVGRAEGADESDDGGDGGGSSAPPAASSRAGSTTDMAGGRGTLMATASAGGSAGGAAATGSRSGAAHSHRRGPSLSALPNVDTSLLIQNSVSANAAGNPFHGRPSPAAALAAALAANGSGRGGGGAGGGGSGPAGGGLATFSGTPGLGSDFTRSFAAASPRTAAGVYTAVQVWALCGHVFVLCVGPVGVGTCRQSQAHRGTRLGKRFLRPPPFHALRITANVVKSTCCFGEKSWKPAGPPANLLRDEAEPRSRLHPAGQTLLGRHCGADAAGQTLRGRRCGADTAPVNRREKERKKKEAPAAANTRALRPVDAPCTSPHLSPSPARSSGRGAGPRARGGGEPRVRRLRCARPGLGRAAPAAGRARVQGSLLHARRQGEEGGQGGGRGLERLRGREGEGRPGPSSRCASSAAGCSDSWPCMCPRFAGASCPDPPTRPADGQTYIYTHT